MPCSSRIRAAASADGEAPSGQVPGVRRSCISRTAGHAIGGPASSRISPMGFSAACQNAIPTAGTEASMPIHSAVHAQGPLARSPSRP